MEELKVIKTEIERLKEDHEEIRQVLGGDMKGNPGALQNIVRIMNAIWDEKHGLEPRVITMERVEVERKGFFKGASFAWGILGGALVGLLMKYVIK